MAYWGWALVLGPNLNLMMQDEVRDQAWEAMQTAVSLKDRVSEKERAMIEALATRYSDDEEAERQALDATYAGAMRALHEAYPRDDNIATLYAASLMNLSPWDYWHGDGSPRESTRDTAAAQERLKKIGARCLQAPHDEGFGIVASYEDPDGNVFEIVELSYDFEKSGR